MSTMTDIFPENIGDLPAPNTIEEQKALAASELPPDDEANAQDLPQSADSVPELDGRPANE